MSVNYKNVVKNSSGLPVKALFECLSCGSSFVESTNRITGYSFKEVVDAISKRDNVKIYCDMKCRLEHMKVNKIKIRNGAAT